MAHVGVYRYVLYVCSFCVGMCVGQCDVGVNVMWVSM